MRRKLALPVLAACALFAVSAPAANAISAGGVIKIIQKALKPIQDVNAGQTAAINGVDKRVDTVVSNLAGVSAKVDAILAAATNTIQPALLALKDGLTAIQAALNNTTTGLVGLNLARPQFGVFDNTGAIAGSTGLSGGSGPTGAAFHGAGGLANFYIVDFGNDVSKRMYTVAQFPTGPLVASTNRVGMAVNCAANASATTLCSTVRGSSDSSPNHVVVQFGSAGSGAADGNWSITAISG